MSVSIIDFQKRKKKCNLQITFNYFDLNALKFNSVCSIVWYMFMYILIVIAFFVSSSSSSSLKKNLFKLELDVSRCIKPKSLRLHS